MHYRYHIHHIPSNNHYYSQYIDMNEKELEHIKSLLKSNIEKTFFSFTDTNSVFVFIPEEIIKFCVISIEPKGT